MASPRRIFTIDSEARLAGGAIFVREAVVDFSSTQNVYRVFKAWKRGKIGQSTTLDLDTLPPC